MKKHKKLIRAYNAVSNTYYETESYFCIFKVINDKYKINNFTYNANYVEVIKGYWPYKHHEGKPYLVLDNTMIYEIPFSIISGLKFKEWLNSD